MLQAGCSSLTICRHSAPAVWARHARQQRVGWVTAVECSRLPRAIHPLNQRHVGAWGRSTVVHVLQFGDAEPEFMLPRDQSVGPLVQQALSEKPGCRPGVADDRRGPGLREQLLIRRTPTVDVDVFHRRAFFITSVWQGKITGQSRADEVPAAICRRAAPAGWRVCEIIDSRLRATGVRTRNFFVLPEA